MKYISDPSSSGGSIDPLAPACHWSRVTSWTQLQAVHTVPTSVSVCGMGEAFGLDATVCVRHSPPALERSSSKLQGTATLAGLRVSAETEGIVY